MFVGPWTDCKKKTGNELQTKWCLLSDQNTHKKLCKSTNHSNGESKS